MTASSTSPSEHCKDCGRKLDRDGVRCISCNDRLRNQAQLRRIKQPVGICACKRRLNRDGFYCTKCNRKHNRRQRDQRRAAWGLPANAKFRRHKGKLIAVIRGPGGTEEKVVSEYAYLGVQTREGKAA